MQWTARVLKCTRLGRGLLRIALLAVTVILASAPQRGPAAADLPDRLTAAGEGEAAIVAGDLTTAEREAMELALGAAFAAALPQALPTGLPPQRQEGLLRELGLLHRDFLLQVRIVSTSTTDNVYRVAVEAAFSNVLVQEQLARRGVVRQDQPAGASRVAELTVRGITSIPRYRELVQELPGRVPGVQSVQPREVYDTQLVLRLLYRGDPAKLEPAIRRWLAEKTGTGTGVESAMPEVSISWVEEPGRQRRPSPTPGPVPPRRPNNPVRATP